MSESIKFSVLIPVYNTEEYLAQCLDSVLSQTYKNFEIILVNDGSTDSSGTICEEYANKYEFIKSIYQRNAGQCPARNKALSFADGDYYIYLDSDDFWEENLLERVKFVIDKYKCDAVIFDRFDIFENTRVEAKLNFENEFVFEKDTKEILYKQFFESERLNNLVLKAFKKELAIYNDESEYFDGICFGEDAYKSASLIIKAKKIVYLSECLYNYRRGVGVTSQLPADFIEKITYSKSLICDLFEKNKSVLQNDFQKEKEKLFLRYMKIITKRSISLYMLHSSMFKKSFARTKHMKFYLNARIFAYPRLNFLEKLIINFLEKENYFIIKIIGIALVIRRKLKNIKHVA